jgi:hypothetical protein
LQLQPLRGRLLLQLLLLLLLLEQGQLLLQQLPGSIWQRKLEVPGLAGVQVGPAGKQTQSMSSQSECITLGFSIQSCCQAVNRKPIT